MQSWIQPFVERSENARPEPAGQLAVTNPEKHALICALQHALEAEAFADGLERDDDDAAAVHVAGWDGSTLAASARLVFPDALRPLPTEREFDLRIEPVSAVVDISRGIVAPSYRTRDHGVFAALLARCWIEVRARGWQNLCGAVTAARLDRYRELGLPLRVLGPARMYWSEERWPVFLDGLEFARATLSLSVSAPVQVFEARPPTHRCSTCTGSATLGRMPTTRARHFVTETNDLAAALDAAARRWPGLTRPQLLVRLALEGDRAARQADEERRRRRLAVVRQYTGMLTGAYGPDYLRKVREEWPA